MPGLLHTTHVAQAIRPRSLARQSDRGLARIATDLRASYDLKSDWLELALVLRAELTGAQDLLVWSHEIGPDPLDAFARETLFRSTADPGAGAEPPLAPIRAPVTLEARGAEALDVALGYAKGLAQTGRKGRQVVILPDASTDLERVADQMPPGLALTIIAVAARRGRGGAPVIAGEDIARLRTAIAAPQSLGVDVLHVRPRNRPAARPKPARAPDSAAPLARALLSAMERDDRLTLLATPPVWEGPLYPVREGWPTRCLSVETTRADAAQALAQGLLAARRTPVICQSTLPPPPRADGPRYDWLGQLPIRHLISARLQGPKADPVLAMDPSHLPLVMGASDQMELARMLATAASYDHGPSVIWDLTPEASAPSEQGDVGPIAIGLGHQVQTGADVALLAFGGAVATALQAADLLAARGLTTTVANARFLAPLDTGLIRRSARHHKALLTVEPGAGAVFGSRVLRYLANSGGLDRGLRCRAVSLAQAGPGAPDLTARDIADTAQETLGDIVPRITAVG